MTNLKSNQYKTSMKVYKVRDKITGLYYCPARKVKVGKDYIRSNLSKKGKIYQSNPLKHILFFDDHTQPIPSKPNAYPSVEPTTREDIQNLKLIEL